MEKISSSSAKVVLWSAASINFITGLLYMWSVISKTLVGDLGWSSKQASLPYTTFTISFVIAMVLFGKLQDTKGPRLVASIGSILLGTGLILSGIFTYPIMMVITMGIITGGGVGILNVSTSPPVVKWFPPEKKGLVTGIVVAGAGLSSTMYSPLTNYLIGSIGLSKTFIYIGIGALIITILLSQRLKNPPIGYIPPNSEYLGNKHKKISKNYEWREMLKSLNFYKLWLMLAFSSSAGLMIIGHISSIANIQAKWQAGFVLVILLSIFNTLGRVLGGIMSDKIGRINLMKIIFILQGLNMFLFARYTNVTALAVGVALAGLCYGGAFAVFPSAISDLYGIKNFGVNYGLMFTGWGVGGIIGPMVAATIYDSTGSYNLAYLVAGALLIISIIIAFTFTIPKDSSIKMRG